MWHRPCAQPCSGFQGTDSRGVLRHLPPHSVFCGHGFLLCCMGRSQQKLTDQDLPLKYSQVHPWGAGAPLWKAEVVTATLSPALQGSGRPQTCGHCGDNRGRVWGHSTACLPSIFNTSLTHKALKSTQILQMPLSSCTEHRSPE